MDTQMKSNETPITEEELEAKYHYNTSPLPWKPRVIKDGNSGWYQTWAVAPSNLCDDFVKLNAELLAAAVNAVPRLIAEVRRLRAIERVVMDPTGCLIESLNKPAELKRQEGGEG